MSGVGIIGGTSLESIEACTEVQREAAVTPYGNASAPLASGEVHGQRLLFLARHGADHALAPHRINYRANLWALRRAGVERVIAIAAVGGISDAMQPASIVIPRQLIDYTHGREHSYCDASEGVLKHIDFTEPYTPHLRRALVDACTTSGVACVDGGVHAVTQGPRLETAAEVDRLARDGCTIVGMTGMPEAALARELGMEYACCAVVVNRAAGRVPGLIDTTAMRENIARGRDKLTRVLTAFLAAKNAL